MNINDIYDKSKAPKGLTADVFPTLSGKPYRILFKEAATGKTKWVKREAFTKGNYSHWVTGEGTCDCRRRAVFMGAGIGTVQGPCGEGAYKLIGFVVGNSNKYVIHVNEDAITKDDDCELVIDSDDDSSEPMGPTIEDDPGDDDYDDDDGNVPF